MNKKKTSKKIKRPAPSKSPLEVNVVDQKLVLSIGIDLLAHAFLNREESLSTVTEETIYRIDDNKEFAKWVGWALMHDRGDGDLNRFQMVLKECFSELVDIGSDSIRYIDGCACG